MLLSSEFCKMVYASLMFTDRHLEMSSSSYVGRHGDSSIVLGDLKNMAAIYSRSKDRGR